jgi:outer membrane protein TolC
MAKVLTIIPAFLQKLVASKVTTQTNRYMSKSAHLIKPVFPQRFTMLALALALTALAPPLRGQLPALSLEEALEVARLNYPLIRRDQQQIAQQQALLPTAAARPGTRVFIAGDEADFQGIRGIHGLGFIQDFNWPGLKARREGLLQQGLLLSNAQLELTQYELRRKVAQAYLEVLYAREQQELTRQEQELFAELLGLAQLRFDLGETGKIPVLSAQGKLQEARLRQQKAQLNATTALTVFNNWLYADTLYEVADRRLPPAEGYFAWFVNRGHPRLLYQQQEVNMAQARIPLEEAQRLPQIRAGGQLQMVDGNSPFYAYQIGLNLPLGLKAIRARVQEAKLAVETSNIELEAARLELENQRRYLLEQLKSEQATLDFLRREMLPLGNQLIDDSRKAYAQGTVEYQDYLRNLEQSLDSRRQHLESLYRYNALKLELEFLSGRK